MIALTLDCETTGDLTEVNDRFEFSFTIKFKNYTMPETNPQIN